MYQSITTFLVWATIPFPQSLDLDPRPQGDPLQSRDPGTWEKSRPSHWHHRSGSFLWHQRKGAQPSSLLTCPTPAFPPNWASISQLKMSLLNSLCSQLRIVFECQRGEHRVDVTAAHAGVTMRCGITARLWALNMYTQPCFKS